MTLLELFNLQLRPLVCMLCSVREFWRATELGVWYFEDCMSEAKGALFSLSVLYDMQFSLCGRLLIAM
jgi:hypothetical protein